MIDLGAHLQAILADRYAIERPLGQGGMAAVFLAQDLKHQRPVAIKVLAPEISRTVGSERFLREIEESAPLEGVAIILEQCVSDRSPGDRR